MGGREALRSHRLFTIVVTIGAPDAVTVVTRRPVSNPRKEQPATRLDHCIIMNPLVPADPPSQYKCGRSAALHSQFWRLF